MTSPFFKGSMNESGYVDTGRIAAFIFLLIVFGGVYLFIVYPQIRGPATDMNVDVKIDPTGNISHYSVALQFVDSTSYSQFLSDLKSKNIRSVNDYEFRTFSSSELFFLKNDSSGNKISLEASKPFDPNQVTSNIRINKNQDYWEFEDVSVINSSHIPEKYINKLTYSLTIPSELIEASTLENSSVILSKEKVLTWRVDRNKNPLNPVGDSVNVPKIFVRFKVPTQNDFPIIPIGIVAVVAIVLIVMIIFRKN